MGLLVDQLAVGFGAALAPANLLLGLVGVVLLRDTLPPGRLRSPGPSPVSGPRGG